MSSIIKVKKKAVVGATARGKSYRAASYTRIGLRSRVDDVLSGLIFSLQCNHLTVPERNLFLYFIDRLVRLKIDLRRG